MEPSIAVGDGRQIITQGAGLETSPGDVAQMAAAGGIDPVLEHHGGEDPQYLIERPALLADRPATDLLDRLARYIGRVLIESIESLARKPRGRSQPRLPLPPIRFQGPRRGLRLGDRQDQRVHRAHRLLH